MEERLVLAGLWSILGVGPKAISEARALGLRDAPAREWAKALGLSENAQSKVPSAAVAELGARMLEQAAERGMQVAFQDDPAYPPRLREIDTAPPLLFHIGKGADVPPRRRIATVGTRTPDRSFWFKLSPLITDIVGARVGVVSGAARGIDSWCHRAAARAKGETWAFLGSALDQIDAAPYQLWKEELEGKGATLFSEFPPGVRAKEETFPRRNRLISGSSDAVLVLRAGAGSGTQHTVDYARKQGRPVLAMAGEPRDKTSVLCNRLLRSGEARLCIDHEDVVVAVGLTLSAKVKPLTAAPPDLSALTPSARALLERVPRDVTEIDAFMNDPSIDSASVVAALYELESCGLILNHGGGRVQRL